MNESTLEAESTITRPKTVNRPNTASSRWNEASGRVSHAVSGDSTVRLVRRFEPRAGAALVAVVTTDHPPCVDAAGESATTARTASAKARPRWA